MKHMRIRAMVACLACLLLLCAGCGDDPSAAQKNYGTPNIHGEYNQDMAKGLLKLVNDGRKTDGKSPLTMDEGDMMEAARTRAREITTLFEHQRPSGDGWETVFSQYHVSYRHAGENIASGQITAESAYNSFWNSQTHRDNLMNENYTHVSIVALRYNGVVYWVQLFRG